MKKKLLQTQISQKKTAYKMLWINSAWFPDAAALDA